MVERGVGRSGAVSGDALVPDVKVTHSLPGPTWSKGDVS